MSADGQIPFEQIAGGEAAIAAAVAASAGSGFDPAAGRSPRLVPYGVRLRGVNVDAKQYGDSGDKPWGRMFGEWDALWDTYIQPQIDNAAAVGANAVRMMGAAPGVIQGLCTQDQYIEGYERLVDYCAAQGMWVYGCLSASQEWFGKTVAQVMPVMEAQAAMLDQKPNVFALDVCQEIGLTSGFISSSSTHDAASQLVTPIRAITNLPLTCSVTVANNTTAGSAQFVATTVTDYDDLFDFFDYHPYYNGMTAADVLAASAAADAVDKVILFGEYGADASNSARYDAVAEVTRVNSTLVGSFAWAAADRLYDGGLDFGMFTETFAPRPALITAFQKILDTEGPRRPGPTVLDEGTVLAKRGRLNIVGAGATATDDGTNDQTIVTIPGLTVQDENGTVATAVTQLDFQGAGVTAAAGTGEVVVTIPGGGSSTSGQLLEKDGLTPPLAFADLLTNEAQDTLLYSD